MKLGSIVSPKFSESLKALMVMTGIPPKTAFAIRGIAKVIQVETEKYEELKMQYVKDAAIKDDKGALIHEGTGIKMDPLKLDDLTKNMKELQGLEVALSEIKFSDLGESPSLNVENLFHLEFIIDG